MYKQAWLSFLFPIQSQKSCPTQQEKGINSCWDLGTFLAAMVTYHMCLEHPCGFHYIYRSISSVCLSQLLCVLGESLLTAVLHQRENKALE